MKDENVNKNNSAEKKKTDNNRKFAFWMAGCCTVIVVMTFVLDIFLIHGGLKKSAVETFVPIEADKNISMVEISNTEK